MEDLLDPNRPEDGGEGEDEGFGEGFGASNNPKHAAAKHSSQSAATSSASHTSNASYSRGDASASRSAQLSNKPLTRTQLENARCLYRIAQQTDGHAFAFAGKSFAHRD